MNSLKKFLSTQILTSLLLALLVNSYSTAQGFGIKGGLSYSGQDYEYDIASFSVDRLSQSGITAGIFLTYDVWLLSELRFEFEYVQKGSGVDVLLTTEQYPEGYERIIIQERIHYISLNVLATPTLARNWTLSPYFVIGPRIDILTSTSSNYPSLVLDDLNPAVLGGTIGIGFKLPLNSSSLLFEGVYNYDFTHAYDKGVLTVKNNSIQLTTGLSF